MKEPKIGIVGGSGYIGTALAVHLSQNTRIKIIDIAPTKLLDPKVEYNYCDITNFNSVKEALMDIDLVIHTAVIQIPKINEQKKMGYEVNFLGTQNVCRAVDEISNIKGLILAGTWHVFGERDLEGMVNESFGFRPDKIEKRAHLYALSKIAQEVIVRYYDEMSSKVYGIIRMGTVLGEKMPEKTAASIFISRGLRSETITPFKHSMYRPMLYVDVNDVCRAFQAYSTKILKGEVSKSDNGLAHITNIFWPKPLSILDLAVIIKNTICKVTEGKINPNIEILDNGEPVIYHASDKEKIRVDIEKVGSFLGISDLIDPEITLERIVTSQLVKNERF